MALLEHRARRLNSIPDPAKLNHRIMCMLAGRGFSADVINKAIAEWQSRPKDQFTAAPDFDDPDFDDPDTDEQDD